MMSAALTTVQSVSISRTSTFLSQVAELDGVVVPWRRRIAIG